MTLFELQKVLGERIEIANDKFLTQEEQIAENSQSETITKLAKQMINNADVILRTEKLVAEGKISKNSADRVVGESE